MNFVWKNLKFMIDLITTYIETAHLAIKDGEKKIQKDTRNTLEKVNLFFFGVIRRKWRNSMLNAEAYNIFASVASDHRIVSARVRLSLQKSKTLARKKLHDWNLFRTDSNLQKLHSIEVHNRFQPLEIENESATERYERFITDHKEAAVKIIPVKKKAKGSQFSDDPRVTSARNKINEAYTDYQRDTRDENRQVYKQAKKELEEAYNAVTEEDLSRKMKVVKKVHANSKHGQS